MFHENRVALNQEVKLHPALLERLANHPVDEFEVRLAEIAAYCDVLLNGEYYPEDLDRLCGILFKRLYCMRSPLVLVPSSVPLPASPSPLPPKDKTTE